MKMFLFYNRTVQKMHASKMKPEKLVKIFPEDYFWSDERKQREEKKEKTRTERIFSGDTEKQNLAENAEHVHVKHACITCHGLTHSALGLYGLFFFGLLCFLHFLMQTHTPC